MRFFHKEPLRKKVNMKKKKFFKSQKERYEYMIKEKSKIFSLILWPLYISLIIFVISVHVPFIHYLFVMSRYYTDIDYKKIYISMYTSGEWVKPLIVVILFIYICNTITWFYYKKKLARQKQP